MPISPASDGQHPELPLRVLAVCENPLLPTGLGTYGREVLSRLAARQDLSITALVTDAEKGDPALLDLPYATIVAEDDGSPDGQFGGGESLTATLLKQRPHAVVGWRDWVQERPLFRHPYRRFYRHLWMTTCDAMPRPREELGDAASLDGLLGYTEWAGRELRAACGPQLKWRGTAAPAADYDVFKPRAAEAAALRQRFGLAGKKIVGTVQRNQFRKMLPELIAGFSRVVSEPEHRDAVLWLHTTLPDSSGFDLAYHLRERSVLSRTLLSYRCHACHEWWPSPYQGLAVPCRVCECGIATPMKASPGGGIAPSELSLLMNCFDVYVHFATNEGFGMPLLEAAACGRPLIGVAHTATGELLEVLGVPEEFRVKPALRAEQGSERWLAAVDPEAVSAVLRTALTASPERLVAFGSEYAARSRAAYSYDRATDTWASAILDAVAASPPPPWNSPAIECRGAVKPPPDTPALAFSELAYSAWPPARPLDILTAAQRVADGRQSRDALWESATALAAEYRSLEGRRLRETTGAKVRSVLGSLPGN